WTGYPVVWGSVSIVALVTGLVWWLRRWLRTPFIDLPPATRRIARFARGVLVAMLAVLVVAGGRRGSVGPRPPPEKDAGATPPRPLPQSAGPHAVPRALAVD